MSCRNSKTQSNLVFHTSIFYHLNFTGFSDCTINGDLEHRSFDNMKHNFEGEHSYVLVQTNALPNNLQNIYIEGINGNDEDEDDSSDERDSRHTPDEDSEENRKKNTALYALKALKIRVYNHTVEFKSHRRLVVSVKNTSPDQTYQYIKQ